MDISNLYLYSLGMSQGHHLGVGNVASFPIPLWTKPRTFGQQQAIMCIQLQLKIT